MEKIVIGLLILVVISMIIYVQYKANNVEHFSECYLTKCKVEKDGMKKCQENLGEYEVIGNFDYPIKCYSLKGLRSYLTGDSYFPDEGDLEAEGINVLDEVHTPYVNEPSTGRAEIQVYELKLKPQIIEEEIKRLKELQAVLEQNKKEVA